MTRLEMITKCVEEQIERGIINPKNKKMHIKSRMNGFNGLKAMDKEECEKWYKEVFC